MSMGGERKFLLLFVQQIGVGYAKDFSQHPQFNVGDEPLAALDALDRVLVHVQAAQLEQVRQSPLGQLWLSGFAEGIYLSSTKIMFSVWGIILVHKTILDIC